MNEHGLTGGGALLCGLIASATFGCGQAGGGPVLTAGSSTRWEGVSERAPGCDSGREAYSVRDVEGEPFLVRGRFVDGVWTEERADEPFPLMARSYPVRVTAGRIWVADGAYERQPDGAIGAFLGRGTNARPLDDTHALGALSTGSATMPELLDVTDPSAPVRITYVLLRNEASAGRTPEGIRDFAIAGDRIVLLAQNQWQLSSMALADLLAAESTPGTERAILDDAFDVVSVQSVSPHASVSAARGDRVIADVDNPFAATGTRPPSNRDGSQPILTVLDARTGALLIDTIDQLDCRGQSAGNCSTAIENGWIARGGRVVAYDRANLFFGGDAQLDLDAYVGGQISVGPWRSDPEQVLQRSAAGRFVVEVCLAPGETRGIAYSYEGETDGVVVTELR
ncbi:MAG: hypothetical protein J0L92_21035 [Deltaproteobacteria bacterium]|nr:hypothetical protein [Deltaproteobacteria bacterium]